jgi:hypothetical protein
MPPPTIARISIGLRPYRSASAPQRGLVAARVSPVTLAEIPVQNASWLPLGTCSSRWRKSGRKGKAKEKPRIAVNSASQSAARLRRQSTRTGSGTTPGSAIGR